MEPTLSTTTIPPHTGLLREENTILRWLFGYSTDGQFPDNSKLSLPPTKLPNSDMRDVRLISIDIDAFQEREQEIQRFHIGISVLDTQFLHGLLYPSPGRKKPKHFIRSYHYVVGCQGYRWGKANLFLFGNFASVTIPELKENLQGLALLNNVILVLHGGDRELSVLKRLDIDVHPLFTIDTVKAAQHPLQLSYRYSLKKLLEEFEIPFRYLHVAGNDAHFTLRTLLMIVIKDAERQSDAEPAWVHVFKRVAHRSLPRIKEKKVAQKDEEEVIKAISDEVDHVAS